MSSPQIMRMLGLPAPAGAAAGFISCALAPLTAESASSEAPLNRTLRRSGPEFATADAIGALLRMTGPSQVVFLRVHSFCRLMQRNPTWLVDVSIGSGWRAAGR